MPLRLANFLPAVAIAGVSQSKVVPGSCAKGECAAETVLLQHRQHHAVAKSSDESEEEAALDAAAEEEMLKLESSVRTYTKLAFENDLSKKSTSSYLQIDRNIGIQDNIVGAFDHFMSENPDIKENFSGAELGEFKKRVVHQILKDMKQAHETTETVSDEDWKAMLAESLEDQKPIATRAGAVHRNSEHSEMFAKFEAWMSKVSKVDYEKRHGSKPEKEQPSDVEFRAIRKAHIKERLRLRSKTRIPDSFDARTAWSHCRDTIMHVRDQGQCGSCWAVAAATVVDGRMCIASGGSFSGSGAYISAGYLASCANNGKNGCDGGDVGAALRWMGENGAPTGFGQSVGCSKYFMGGGDAEFHFSGSDVQTPSCPMTCSRTEYPRSLHEDLFTPTSYGGRIRRTTNVDEAKASLMQGGPVPVIINADDDFMQYSDGIWSPPCTSEMNHAVTMYAFGVENRQNYLQLMNSYGVGWGNAGSFKMTECGFVQGLIFPDLSSENWPLPLPTDDSPTGPVHHRAAGARYTDDGDECQQSWGYADQWCDTYCCAIGEPDEWCFTGYSSWGYCTPRGASWMAANATPTPTPSPTPSPSPPVTHGWRVMRGPCSIDNAGCVSSPNYPNGYDNSASCDIDPGADSLSIYVDHFQTESNYDNLTVNGVLYSGNDGKGGTAPHNIVPTETIHWNADGSISDAGWKLCPNGEPSPAPTPTPPLESRRRYWG